MSAIEKSDVLPLRTQPVCRELTSPCVLTYEDNPAFYDTLADQGISYLQYIERLRKNGKCPAYELDEPHNLTVCALVAITNKLRFDDELEIGDQLFRLVGDMFAMEENSARHGIMSAQMSTNAIEFIQSHVAPEPQRCFEYPSQLNEIFDFT